MPKEEQNKLKREITSYKNSIIHTKNNNKLYLKQQHKAHTLININASEKCHMNSRGITDDPLQEQ